MPKSASHTAALTAHEHAALYIQLSALLSKMGKLPEATKVLNDAITEFRSTPQEMQVILAQANLSLEKKDAEVNDQLSASVSYIALSS